jgi:hypothetical protein
MPNRVELIGGERVRTPPGRDPGMYYRGARHALTAGAKTTEQEMR